MKMLLRSPFVGLFLLLSILFIERGANAVTSDQFAYQNYFRTGIGRDNQGGQQTCFTNPLSSDHNDFRLGNECGSYSELRLRAITVKGKDNEPFFAAETMFSFATPNEVNVEPVGLNLRELFIEAGNLFDGHLGFWVGKRYYRDVDAHMDDFFYYAMITGNGAGISNIDTGQGKLAMAFFLNSLNDSSPTVTIPSTSSTVGVPQGEYFDLRLSDMPLTEKDHLHLWLGLADQQSTLITSGPLNGQTLGNFGGLVFGERYRRTLAHGTNDLAVLYGYGLLSRFDTESVMVGSTLTNLTTSPGIAGFTAGNIIGKAQGLRVLDHATWEYPDWAMHAVGILELRKNYFSSNQSGWYFSTGIRPVYFLSDHFHVAFELGHDESQDGGFNNGRVMRLTRATIAPEIVAARSIWSRPALRAFYTVSFWNTEAEGQIGGLTYAGTTFGSNWGFQGEIWF